MHNGQNLKGCLQIESNLCEFDSELRGYAVVRLLGLFVREMDGLWSVLSVCEVRVIVGRGMEPKSFEMSVDSR
jgi:hypothetical protein